MSKVILEGNFEIKGLMKNKIPVSIYNADIKEHIKSFDSIKDCANHLGINAYAASAYIRDKSRFGARRKKGRKYKYDFPILIKYN